MPEFSPCYGVLHNPFCYKFNFVPAVIPKTTQCRAVSGLTDVVNLSHSVIIPAIKECLVCTIICHVLGVLFRQGVLKLSYR